ncbi:MAG: polysaccharide deacetylase family protein [Flavitalea sp.]
MLNFRNTNILFFLLLIFAAGYSMMYHIFPIIYPILLLIYSVIIFYGCYNIRSNFFLSVICSAKTNEKEIAVSFDDGPASNYTTEILRTLKENKVEAAFFCIGSRIAGKEEIVERIHKEGHLIGNHSYSHHFWFDMFSSKKMLADMKMMDAEMKNKISITPKLFRPPYGVINPNLKKAIIKGRYIPIGWSVRSMDTVIKDEKKLLNKLTRSLRPGAIFLFHDTSKTTLAILPAFFKHAAQSGYKIVRLDKMLNLQAYA